MACASSCGGAHGSTAFLTSELVVAKLSGKVVLVTSDFDTVALSRACDQFTGAEIEAVFIDALHEAYADGREPKAKDIVEAMTRCVPLAQLMDGEIAALRHWAKGRAREAASHSNPGPASASRNGRRIPSMANWAAAS